jgi:hypothetical protein
MKLLEIDKVVQSHATAEEPAWVWMEEIPDGADRSDLDELTHPF